MCIIETKTYTHPDGSRELIETLKACGSGSISRPCLEPARRHIGDARIIETRPSSRSSRDPTSPVIVTNDRRRRETTYVDLNRKATVRRRNTASHRLPYENATTSDQSLMDSPISGLTTRVVDPMPTTPTPPPAAPGPVSSGYNDNPFAPLDITANRDRPFVHGYRSTNRPADLSDAGDSSDRTRQQPPSARSFVPMPSGRLSGRPQRPSNMFIDTSMRPTSSTGSPISSSPGLSRLPRRSYGSDRHDSARESQASSKESDLFSRERVRRSVRAIDEARRPAEDESRQQVQEEERRQAQLEQDRYAARDQARAENAASYREQDRLAARERARAQDAADRRERDRQADREARRNASRERHRQASQERHRRDAAAALEAEQDEERQRRVDAEYEQMRRERAAADARNREDQRIEQLRRDAEALRLDDERRARDPRPRRVTGDSYISPSSPRFQPAPWPPRRTPPYGSVAVHQGPSSRRSNPLRERGQGVIAEERGRAAGERMSGPYQRTSTEMYDDVDDYYADEGYIDDRRRRRDARDAYRDM